MFLLIDYMRAAVQHKAVNSVVARLALAVRVNTASGDNRHIRVLADMKIIIYHIVNIPYGHACGNVDVLLLGAGRDIDIDSSSALLGLNPDILRGAHARALSVLADIERAVKVFSVPVRNFPQDFFRHLIHRLVSPFLSGSFPPSHPPEAAGESPPSVLRHAPFRSPPLRYHPQYSAVFPGVK